MTTYNSNNVTLAITTYKHEPHCLTLLPKPVSEIKYTVMNGVIEEDHAVKSIGLYGDTIVTFKNGLTYSKGLYSHTYRINLPSLPCTCTPEEVENKITGFSCDEPITIERSEA